MLNNFYIRPADLDFVGSGLVRPECVLCCADGSVYASHSGGGVTRIAADGRQQHILGHPSAEAQDSPPVTVATNGFCLRRDGSFLCANLQPPGGVWQLERNGEQRPFWLEIDGYQPPSVNFVYEDKQGRVWITVSTRREPRSLGYRPDVDDGFIVLVDQRGARLVADGLGFTNEAKLDPGGNWLYVNETFVRRTSRFKVAADGTLGQRETVAEYGPGTFPDGLDFDQQGGLWLTSVLSNRIIRLTPDGQQQILLEENDPEQLQEIETVYQAGQLDRPHMDTIRTEVMKSVSSLAFGGPDRKTVYLGNLLDQRLYCFRSPVAGIEPPHWSVRFAD